MMPRAQRSKVQPNETTVIQYEGQETLVEVWDNYADEGTKGAHTRRKRGEVLKVVFDYCQAGLAGNSNFSKDQIKRFIEGPESLIAFGKFIVTISKIKGIRIGKTLSEEIAKDVRIAYAAEASSLDEMVSKK